MPILPVRRGQDHLIPIFILRLRMLGREAVFAVAARATSIEMMMVVGRGVR